MKTRRTQDFTYNGLFFSEQKDLEKPVEVEIIGVRVPPDPGMVFVREGDKEYNVPTFVLEECPRIDWDKLLTDKQKKLAVIFGNGGFETTVLPIDQVPVKEAA